MNVVTRLGLWLVKVSAPPTVASTMRAAVVVAQREIDHIEAEQHETRRQLALIIQDAKASNILHREQSEGR